MKTKRLLGFVAIAVASVGILAACGKDAAKDQTVVRVGTMAKSESEQARWDKIEEILKKEGITLKFSEFTDYSQPNVALNNGDIDINAFQHYNFLDNWNSDHKADLVPIAETYFTAFRVYSGTEGGKNKYKDIKELPEGATIAIPNDAVNESRALNLLQSAGLIKLSVGANDKAKLTDVSENSKNLNIREVDAIVHVVRCFEDSNIVHVDGSIDPLRDIETINLELIFSDIEILERRIAKQSKGAFNNKDLAKEVELLKAIKAHLEDGKLARSFEVEDEDDREFINSLNLLTWKPVIFAANVAEGDLADDGASNHYVQEVREYAKANDCEVFVICAEIEQEIAELDDDEKQMFLDDLGLKESGLEKLIAASYRILGLMSYLTAGPQESRAWTIKVGTKAPQAAGKIHSDFERGFIRAEVVSYDDLMACGSMNAAKEKGLVRSEGKEYVMKDGDVVLFRFNV